MAFTLPALPYPTNALEPHIDARTMEIHHGKHHAAYVSKLNGAIDGTEMADKSLDELIKNGIKANYKYVYLRERIENFLEEHQGQGHPELTEILRNAQVLNDFVDQHIQTDDLVGMVRKVLNDEAKAIRLKTKVSEESRKYTDEERDLIKGLDEVHRI